MVYILLRYTQFRYKRLLSRYVLICRVNAGAVIFGSLIWFWLCKWVQPTVFHVTLASNLPSLKKGTYQVAATHNGVFKGLELELEKFSGNKTRQVRLLQSCKNRSKYQGTTRVKLVTKRTLSPFLGELRPNTLFRSLKIFTY